MAPKVKRVVSKKRKEPGSSGAAEAVAAEGIFLLRLSCEFSRCSSPNCSLYCLLRLTGREEVPAAEEHAADPILISDDESEGRANSAAPDPAPQPGAEPCLEIPPITALAPGQRSVPSESQPWQARIEEFEGAVRQAISLVELGMGSFDSFRQSLYDRVADLRRSGENRLATRCVRELRLLEPRMMVLEDLLRGGPEAKMASCLAHFGRQEALEQETRSKEIADLESAANFWVSQQRLLEEQVIDLNHTTARLRAELGRAEAKWKALQSDVVKVNENAEAEIRRLLALRQADAAAASNREDRIRKAAENKAREDHASQVEAVKEEISTFSVFD